MPDDVLKAWREAGSRGVGARKEWEARFAELSNRKRAEFDRRLRHERPASLAKALKAHKKALLETPQNIATRKSSKSAIDAIATAMPMEFLAGSADLTGSNNNKAKSAVNFSAKTPKGRFVHYGIREHGMAAAMNGIFLHGGFAPNGATFLCFTDYARPAMRLAALDGHRRRLCDDPRFDRSRRRRPDPPAGRTSRRTARHSQYARVPPLRCDRGDRVLGARAQPDRRPDGAGADPPEPAAIAHLGAADIPCSHGAYELVAAQGEAKVSLFASGSEVEIAVAAQKQLAERGIAARVVSVPALELLLAQPADKQKAIIGNAPVKVAIEAAVRLGWDAVIGTRWRIHRHARFRRQRTGQGSLQALRNYRRSRGQRSPEASLDIAPDVFEVIFSDHASG